MKAALDFIENWIKISGYVYRHEELNDDGQRKHMYIIQHDMGVKWSIYLSNLYQFLFDELRKIKKKYNLKRLQIH